MGDPELHFGSQHFGSQLAISISQRLALDPPRQSPLAELPGRPKLAVNGDPGSQPIRNVVSVCGPVMRHAAGWETGAGERRRRGWGLWLGAGSGAPGVGENPQNL